MSIFGVNISVSGNLNITNNLNISKNLNVGTLRINSGTITDTSGIVDFGSNNLTTTGDLNIGDIVFSLGDNITSTSGIIDFQTTDLSTTGSIECGTCNIITTNPLLDFSLTGSGFDYETRLLRNSGTNGDFEIVNRGTGSFNIYTNMTKGLSILGSNGNVGIGTNNPLDKLSLSGTFTYTRVEGGNNCFGYYGGGNSNSGTGATNPWIASLSGSKGDAETIATSTNGWLWYNRSDNGNLELARRNGSTTDTEVMTFVRSSGNVGIGTATPTAKLDLYQTENTSAEWIKNTHATFTNNSLIIDITRAQNSAYSFVLCRSSGSGDNEFRFAGDGIAYADGGWNTPAADYAEYFESLNNDKIDLGKCVVIDNTHNNKISKVREYDKNKDKTNDILGVVRAKKKCRGGIVGNNHDNKWKDKYLTNDFGEYLYEDYYAYEWVDENDKEHSYNVGEVPDDIIMPDDVKTITLERRIKNPKYNKKFKYIPYEDRDEKVLVALMGQIPKLKTEPMKKEWQKCYDISDNVEMVYIK